MLLALPSPSPGAAVASSVAAFASAPRCATADHSLLLPAELAHHALLLAHHQHLGARLHVQGVRLLDHALDLHDGRLEWVN